MNGINGVHGGLKEDGAALCQAALGRVSPSTDLTPVWKFAVASVTGRPVEISAYLVSLLLVTSSS